MARCAVSSEFAEVRPFRRQPIRLNVAGSRTITSVPFVADAIMASGWTLTVVIEG